MALDVDKLTQEQSDRFSAVVTSRERLLGETYTTAFERVRAGDSNEHWILTGEHTAEQKAAARWRP